MNQIQVRVNGSPGPGPGSCRAAEAARPLSQTGGGGQAAAAAQPGCLGVSRVPREEWIGDASKREPRLGKERPRGEGSRQRWCQGIRASTLRLAPALSQVGHSSRWRGGAASQICVQSLWSLLMHIPMTSLGNILLLLPIHR